MKAEEKGIRIDAPRTDDRAPATGEFRRVLQVLLNLLGNAIRYSPDNSQIWIRVDREGDRAMVTVADQGQGIDAGQQAVVFEKFERLGRTDSGEFGAWPLYRAPAGARDGRRPDRRQRAGAGRAVYAEPASARGCLGGAGLSGVASGRSLPLFRHPGPDPGSATAMKSVDPGSGPG